MRRVRYGLPGAIGGERHPATKNRQCQASAIPERHSRVTGGGTEQAGGGGLVTIDRHDLDVELRHDLEDLFCRRAAVGQLGDHLGLIDGAQQRPTHPLHGTIGTTFIKKCRKYGRSVKNDRRVSHVLPLYGDQR